VVYIMLQARSKEGVLVTIATLTKTEIEKMRTKPFFCPVCEERVIIKAGSKIIPHFSHQAKTNCVYQERGEGVYHEKGKLILYQWLNKQQLQVELEVYI